MYERERECLVELLRRPSDRPPIEDAAVLQALARVPRHCFVPEDQIANAYDDRPLPIGAGQTISQPFVVASMTEVLRLRPKHKVLEIGSGCGYQTAVLAELAAEIFSIEFHHELARLAEQRLDALGYENIHIRQGDGFYGWPEAAPFDRIIVTCRATTAPPSLLDQLSPQNGLMVIPIGEEESQILKLYTRNNDHITSKDLYPVRFVPLLREEE